MGHPDYKWKLRKITRNERKHFTLGKGQNKTSISTPQEFDRQIGGYSTRTLFQVIRLIQSLLGVFIPCDRQHTLNTIVTNSIPKMQILISIVSIVWIKVNVSIFENIELQSTFASIQPHRCTSFTLFT